MFKILEAFLLLKGICDDLDTEIKDYKGITYRAVIHFICSIPNPRRKRIYSDLIVIRDYKYNFELFFNSYVVLYAVTMQNLSIKKDREHNLLTVQKSKNVKSKA